jgi:ribose transport system substrate-binding protein
MRNKFILLACIILLCFGSIFSQALKNNSLQKKITIGMIGKIANNPVFIATHTGAQIAAKEIGKKYNIEIDIKWQTPDEENVQSQAAAIERFGRSGVDGIAIACTDANYLTSVIDSAVDRGTPIMCFDSDAPKSKRFAYHGANDYEFGKMLMKELASELNEKGIIAILAGNKNALNLRHRLAGIMDELKKHPNIKLSPDNVYHNIDIPKIASEKVRQIQKNNSNIKGWIFITSVALLIENSLKWNPGEVKVVAGQAVPAELEYVKSGYVQKLVGINCFQMGYKSVEILLEKILFKRTPKEQITFTPLTAVSKKNVEEWSINWKKWLIKDAVSHN